MNAGNANVDSDDGECPICLQPLPVETFRCTERSILFCCGKHVCSPCSTSLQRHLLSAEASLETAVSVAGPLSVEGREAEQEWIAAGRCPMCRTRLPFSQEQAFRLVKSRVDEHDDWAWAHLQLGLFYRDGLGCEGDKKLAFLHISKAAELSNSAEALHILGNFFHGGVGVQESLVDAMRCFEAAAAQGHAGSQHTVAMNWLRRGKVDPARAVRLLISVSEQGLDIAQSELAVCFANGKGIGRSLEKALYWHRKVAGQGSAKGMANVSVTLFGMAEAKYGGPGGIRPVDGDNDIPEAL